MIGWIRAPRTITDNWSLLNQTRGKYLIVADKNNKIYVDAYLSLYGAREECFIYYFADKNGKRIRNARFFAYREDVLEDMIKERIINDITSKPWILP